MSIRILHCGDNLQNYYICIEKEVAGFSQLSPAAGDSIYLAVKVMGLSYIGARGIIGTPSYLKPWPNSKKYKFEFSLTNIEFCKPFNIHPLSQFGGTHWAAIFLQASKAIKNEGAVNFLIEQFEKNKSQEMQRF